MRAAAGLRRSRSRFAILALVTGATTLNYLDRAVMSVAAKPLTEELGISAALMGLIFSAFSWTYAAAQIPGGLVLDRIGTRVTYACSLVIWSLFTFLHGFAGSIGVLVGLRMGLGVAEAPCYPCNSRILSTWFPQRERARATGVYSVGQYVGLALLTPVLFWIAARFGWRALFLIVGAIGIVYGVVWYLLYRDPGRHPGLNAAEREHIAAGGGLEAQTSTTFSWAIMVRLLAKRQILGASLGQFANNSTLVFLITWLPTYLATERHMDFVKSGFYLALPYISASIGVLVGGTISDWLVERTGSATIGRKAPIIAGLVLISPLVLAGSVQDNRVLIAVMSVAAFGQGICNLGWTLISEVAPKAQIGLTGGIFNLFANLAGIVTPLVIGLVVQATGSFGGALAYVGIIALLGACCYLFIVGGIRRLDPIKDGELAG